MNVSHTIKDKEIPRWQPLQRISRFSRLSPKLTIKRFVLVFLAIATLLILLTPSHVKRIPALTAEEEDDTVAIRHGEELKDMISRKISLLKQPVIFVTSQDLYNSWGLTALACEFALKGKLNVLMIF